MPTPRPARPRPRSSRGPAAARRARLLVTALLAVLSVLAGPAIAHADPSPSPSPSTAAQLADAKTRAADLAHQVSDLQHQAEAASEAYNDSAATLSVTIANQVSARSDLKVAQALAAQQRDDVVERARAVYESGGELTAYASVLSSTDVNDLGSRLAAVRNVTATSREQGTTAAAAVAAAAQAQTALDTLVEEQQTLDAKARDQKDQVTRLLAQTATLQQGADSDVVALAAQLQAEQEAAKEAAFRAQLAAAGGYAIPGGVLTTFADLATRPDGVAADPLNQAAFLAIQKYVGRPYVWGGTGPVGYDCSGLVGQAFADAGLILPRVGHLQYLAGTHPTLSELRAGDLLFWSDDPTDFNAIEHVAMYAGSGLMVSANHTGDTVRLQPVWDSTVFGFTRVDATTAATVPGGRWAPGQTGA